ncbi:hypothetical protein Cgig2_030694 [Carnegiea gigantea]|uniref:DUF4283 domain-containing protein n=1 Tax=Carnegiea gigantea TaxID=171969 RepID=A0A9Q1GSD5_9CARY|nr:hypothetical protein Cgig2_030694 [Carnegiea gigantea]
MSGNISGSPNPTLESGGVPNRELSQVNLNATLQAIEWVEVQTIIESDLSPAQSIGHQVSSYASLVDPEEGIKCLSKQWSMLGIPIKTDKVTKDKSALSYAKLLIEMPLKGAFPEHIDFINDWDVVVRQKMLGHEEIHCRKKAKIRREWRPVQRGEGQQEVAQQSSIPTPQHTEEGKEQEGFITPKRTVQGSSIHKQIDLVKDQHLKTFLYLMADHEKYAPNHPNTDRTATSVNPARAIASTVTLALVSSYPSLIDPGKDHSLKFIRSAVVNGTKCAKIEQQDVISEVEYWSQAIICRVLGADPPLRVVEGYVRRIWHQYGIDKVVVATKGIYLVRFTSMEDKEAVLRKDVKYWGPDSLSKMGSLLGMPFKSDKHGRDKTFLNYARVLIDMELEGPFPEYVEFINDKDIVMRQQVKYEWMSLRCTHCNMYGHIDMECRKKDVHKNGERWQIVIQGMSRELYSPTVELIIARQEELHPEQFHLVKA